jgi:hypothetical protein
VQRSFPQIQFAVWIMIIGASTIARAAMFRLVDHGELPAYGKTFGATLLDVNQDGLLDLFISRHGGRPALCVNRGGLHFAVSDNVAFPVDDPGDHHGSAACDFDRDGDWDIYLTVGAQKGKGVGHNQLWEAVAPNVFRSAVDDRHMLADSTGRGRGAIWLALGETPYPELMVLNYYSLPRLFRYDGSSWQDHSHLVRLERAHPTREIPPEHPSYQWLGTAASSDFDLDGDMDLFVAGHVRGLLRNDDTGLLIDVTEQVGIPVAEPGYHAVWTDDVDNDGDFDLFGLDRGVGRLVMWLNDGFHEDMHFQQGPPPLPGDPHFGGCRSFSLADLDNDGYVDLYLLRQDGSHNVANLLARGLGDGTFRPANQEWGGTGEHVSGLPQCAWPIDLDLDGDLDLLLLHGGEDFPERDGAVVLYENTTANGGIGLTLVAKGGPPHGLGALVRLTTSRGIITRQVRCVANPWNATIPPLHFGVGSDTGPFQMEVTWLDGQCRTYRIPKSHASYRLTEDADEIELVTGDASGG